MRGVFVANHASYLDVFVLLAVLPRPVSFVAKRELQSHALVAAILRRLGTVFVDRFDGVEDLRGFGQVARATPLFFFPEGTFTARPGLRPFRLGAFQLAVGEGLDVIPVALGGTRELLPDGSWRFVGLANFSDILLCQTSPCLEPLGFYFTLLVTLL